MPSHFYFLLVSFVQGGEAIRVEMKQKAAMYMIPTTLQQEEMKSSSPHLSIRVPTDEDVVNAWRSNAQAALDAAVGQSGIMLSDMHELTQHYMCLDNRCGNVTDGIKFSREMQCGNRVVLVSRVPTTNESADYLECSMIFQGSKTLKNFTNAANFKRVREWAGYTTTRKGSFHMGFVTQMDGYFNDACFRKMVSRALLGNQRRKRCGRIISMGYSLGGSVASLFAAAANGMAEYIQVSDDIKNRHGVYGDRAAAALREALKETWRLDARGKKQVKIWYDDVFPVETLRDGFRRWRKMGGSIPVPNVEIYAQAAPPITFNFFDRDSPGGLGTSPLMNRHPNAENGAFKGLRLNAAKEVFTCSNYMKILRFGLADARTRTLFKGDPGEDGMAEMSGAKVPMLTIPNSFATWRLLSPFFLHNADPGYQPTKAQFRAAAVRISAHPYDYAVAYTHVNGKTISTISNVTLEPDNGWLWSMFDGRSPGLLPVCSEAIFPEKLRAIHNSASYRSVLENVAASFASFASFTHQQPIHAKSRDLALQSNDSGICDKEACGSPRFQHSVTSESAV